MEFPRENVGITQLIIELLFIAYLAVCIDFNKMICVRKNMDQIFNYDVIL